MKTLIRILLSLALTAAFLPCRAQKSVLRSSVTYEKMQANGVRLPVIGELVTQAPDINKQYWWSIGCETLDRDFSVPSGLNLWCVSDNLRKGAATNAVQIAEILLRLI